MDPRTEKLVQKLHRNPHDPEALRAVRNHLASEGRFRSLAKVLEWWAPKAPTDEEGGDALADAADALEQAGEEPERALRLYQQAVERYPAQERASLRLEALLVEAGRFE